MILIKVKVILVVFSMKLLISMLPNSCQDLSFVLRNFVKFDKAQNPDSALLCDASRDEIELDANGKVNPDSAEMRLKRKLMEKIN